MRSLSMFTSTFTSTFVSTVRKSYPDRSIELQGVIGKHFLEVSTAKPQVRKSDEVRRHFVNMLNLKSPNRIIDQRLYVPNRLLACEALGSFGPDAASALNELQKLRNSKDYSDVIRAAADAITKIEEQAK